MAFCPNVGLHQKELDYYTQYSWVAFNFEQTDLAEVVFLRTDRDAGGMYLEPMKTIYRASQMQTTSNMATKGICRCCCRAEGHAASLEEQRAS